MISAAQGERIGAALKPIPGGVSAAACPHAGRRGQVQAFVRGLSSRSRYERFFTSIAELSPKQLERITAARA